jgi:putative transposase
MIRTFRYPLKPTKEQEKILSHWLASCCDLYNGALQERRDAYRKLGKSISYNDQQLSLKLIRAEDEDWKAIPAVVGRSALRRLDKAFNAFFRRIKRGDKPGYPRFKPKQRFYSFSFQQALKTESEKVFIPKLGWVKFHEYRPLHGTIKDVLVKRELGKWFVSFQVDLGEAPKKMEVKSIPVERQVGIDVGLKSLAVLSTGEVIQNPHFGSKSAAVLARRQRYLSRKKKGSKNRRRAVILVAKAHKHIANQRQDAARKIAKSLVERFDLICFEDLNVAGMAKGLFSKSINDAGWTLLRQATKNKAESAGSWDVGVNPSGTTIDCSCCGQPVPKGLEERIHKCLRCGLVLCRDHNAAINILRRGVRLVGLSELPQITTEVGET